MIATKSHPKTTKKLIFKKAETEQEYANIYESREKICREKFPYLLNYQNKYPAEDNFDQHSVLFYVSNEENNVIGSCRITPYISSEAGWEISKNLPKNLHLPFDPQKTVQLNRVYLDNEYRNQNLHVFLFYNFSEWVLKNTIYSDYFATCNLVLVRLYKEIGARLEIPQGFKLIGRGEHDYYLVSGKITQFNSIIKTKFLNNDTNR